MPKNTFLVVAALAVFAALVAGVNIGRKVTQEPQQAAQTQTSPKIQPSPTLAYVSYTSAACGVTLSVPDTFRKLEASSGGTLFINTGDPGSSVALMCQKTLPKPAESTPSAVTVQNLSATLYRSRSAGKEIDELHFTHPDSRMQILIRAPADILREIRDTLQIVTPK